MRKLCFMYVYIPRAVVICDFGQTDVSKMFLGKVFARILLLLNNTGIIL